ncbi:hypothetical protein EDC94DRAFT_597819 [Helicostylum pulchrum]|nr:hypothetical protein EDC94DRAFT_597819 [Helicostylum pulchrum]
MYIELLRSYRHIYTLLITNSFYTIMVHLFRLPASDVFFIMVILLFKGLLNKNGFSALRQ